MKLRVDCESGYSGCDHPKSFETDGQREIVKQIIKEWREPGAKHYLVQTEAGKKYKLMFDETSGGWNAPEISISTQPQEH